MPPGLSEETPQRGSKLKENVNMPVPGHARACWDSCGCLG